MAKSVGVTPTLLALDQFTQAARGLGVLVFLNSILSGSDLGRAVMIFAISQFLAALVFSMLGEPTLISPLRNVESHAHRIAARVAAAAVAVAFVILVFGLAVGAPFQLCVLLTVIAGVASWSDTVRCLDSRLGGMRAAFARNLLLTALIWALPLLSADVVADNLSVATAVLWVLVAATVRGRRPQSSPTTDEPWGWRPGAAASTGLAETLISHAVIQGSIFMVAATVGVAAVAPFRLAQAVLGPIQVMAVGVRLSVSSWLTRSRSRLTSRDGRALFIVSLCVAVLCLLYVVALNAVPAAWLSAVLASPWAQTSALVWPLAIQACFSAMSSVWVAQLRVAGILSAPLLVKAVSASLSLGCFAALLMRDEALHVALWGLPVGPVATMPVWLVLVFRMNRDRSHGYL